jgi:hypothetical protein
MFCSSQELDFSSWDDYRIEAVQELTWVWTQDKAVLALQTDCAAARDDVAKPRLTVPKTAVSGKGHSW